MYRRETITQMQVNVQGIIPVFHKTQHWNLTMMVIGIVMAKSVQLTNITPEVDGQWQRAGSLAVKDSTLYDRYLVLENLDEGERQAALVLLDSLIARQRLRELAATTTLGTQSGKPLVSN